MKHLVSKKTHCSLLLLLLLLGGYANAQEVYVKSFQKLETDLFPRTNPRLDLNDDPCSVVRVNVPHTKDFVFEGNVLGDVIYKPGEAIVYMPTGTRNISVKSEKYGSLDYYFPQKLDKQVAYRLRLGLQLVDDNKTRTLVMPVVGVSSALSYGVMVGVVKKTGAYLKVKTNFQSVSGDLECDSQGMIAGDSQMPWYTGKDKIGRFAITGGVLQRIIRPLYLYAGAGYGYKKLGWELANGEWAQNTEDSCDGVEAEVGGIFRIKNVALSAGIQTNSFKHFEATIGVGIMF